jgi:hypothetical protein
MDYLAFLEGRLDLIERFYNAAAEPFETTKRRIDAGEEPFVPKYAPGDFEGYEYQGEWDEANDCLRMLGHCSLSYVSKALQNYLCEFIAHEAKVSTDEIDKVLPRRKGGSSGSWLHRYACFLEDKTAFRWNDSPVSLAQLEEINLARNVIWHDPSIDGALPMQTEDDAKRFLKPTYGDEMYMAMRDADSVVVKDQDGNPLTLTPMTVPIEVTREKLAGAIEDVRRFCRFAERSFSSA